MAVRQDGIIKLKERLVMKCPKCGLTNPETAQNCDCGYNFGKDGLENSLTASELSIKSKKYKNIKILKILAVFFVAILLGLLTHYFGSKYNDRAWQNHLKKSDLQTRLQKEEKIIKNLQEQYDNGEIEWSIYLAGRQGSNDRIEGYIRYQQYDWNKKMKTSININEYYLPILMFIISLIISYHLILKIKSGNRFVNIANESEKYLFPELVICYFCQEEIELEDRERLEGVFICPECDKKNVKT